MQLVLHLHARALVIFLSYSRFLFQPCATAFLSFLVAVVVVARSNRYDKFPRRQRRVAGNWPILPDRFTGFSQLKVQVRRGERKRQRDRSFSQLRFFTACSRVVWCSGFSQTSILLPKFYIFSEVAIMSSGYPALIVLLDRCRFLYLAGVFFGGLPFSNA